MRMPRRSRSLRSAARRFCSSRQREQHEAAVRPCQSTPAARAPQQTHLKALALQERCHHRLLLPQRCCPRLPQVVGSGGVAAAAQAETWQRTAPQQRLHVRLQRRALLRPLAGRAAMPAVAGVRPAWRCCLAALQQQQQASSGRRQQQRRCAAHAGERSMPYCLLAPCYTIHSLSHGGLCGRCAHSGLAGVAPHRRAAAALNEPVLAPTSSLAHAGAAAARGEQTRRRVTLATATATAPPLRPMHQHQYPSCRPACQTLAPTLLCDH